MACEYKHGGAQHAVQPKPRAKTVPKKEKRKLLLTSVTVS
jgi:hypothetical protein